MTIIRRLLSGTAALAAAVSLTGGVASAHPGGVGGGTIHETGPDSTTTIRTEAKNRVDVRNRNNITVDNQNHQTAESGRVKVDRATTAGNVYSGNTYNKASQDVSLKVDNHSAATVKAAEPSMPKGAVGGGHISNTGPDSTTRITTNLENRVNVDNRNDVNISNTNEQTAKSGNVEVSRVTTVKDVASGDASNVYHSNVSLNITN